MCEIILYSVAMKCVREMNMWEQCSLNMEGETRERAEQAYVRQGIGLFEKVMKIEIVRMKVNNRLRHIHQKHWYGTVHSSQGEVQWK